MSHLTKNPWIVCLTASLFFAYEFFQINMFNALDTELMRTFQVDGETLSWLSSTYFYGVILLLLPAGMILDHISPRKIILITMIASILGTVTFSISQNWEQAALSRFIVGLTAGPFALLSVLKLSSRWFKPTKMAFVTGVVVSMGMIAGMMAQTPFTYLVQMLGWRESLWVNSIIGCAIFVLLFIFVRDFSSDRVHVHIPKKQDQAFLSFLHDLKKIVLTPINWQCGLFAALTNLPIFLLGALWGGLYLTQAHGFTRLEASYVTIMLYLGMLIGSSFFGWFSDKIQHRKMPMLLGGGFCLLSILVVMHLGSANLSMYCFWFLMMGFGSGAQVLAYPTIAENNPPEVMGCAEGLAATLIMGAGAVFQPVLGRMIKMHWDGAIIDQVAQYSPENFYFGLSLIPVAILMALIVVAMMKPHTGSP
jgi:MFS family permease